jgi:DNA polymerase type B, organellar and viral
MVRLSEESFQRNRELQGKRNATSNPSRQRNYDHLASDIRRLEMREFVGWDGEGYTAFVVDSSGVITKQHRYMLFGSSSGHYESSIDLRTVTCLDLILYVESQNRDVFHVGFSFEYDVNMILRDLEWRYLAILYDTGVVKWRGYRIKHIPHKLFSVSKDGVSATIFDVFGFFHSTYLAALSKHHIGTQSQLSRIKKGKDSRSYFTYSQLAEVIQYWSVEISLLPILMNHLREACYGAGFYITQWHGPGALASFAIKKYGILRYKPYKNIPTAVRVASRFAYAGGRFQAWRCGAWNGDIYTADINSAYSYACSQLPRLDIGKWKHTNNPRIESARDIQHFGLYRIAFDAREMDERARAHCIPFPLFHRDKNGRLAWPARTEGWYWSPEAALVAGSKYARILECWEFDDNGERPFAFVQGAFDRRLQLQQSGNPAEKAYKWFLASIYGQLAQRVGWDRATRKPPRSHCLEWAGYITSYCRAFVYRAAIGVAKQGGLISIDTDGVTSTVPFNENRLPNGVGSGLGQWKLENFTEILYWQNGIYWVRLPEGACKRDHEHTSGGCWEDPKTRGVPRGSISRRHAEQSFHARFGINSAGDRKSSRTSPNPAISITRNRFIGYRQAMQHQFDTWRQWMTEPVEIEFGGSGKGRHIASLCTECTDNRSYQSASAQVDHCSMPGNNIRMHTIVHFPPDHVDSYPHNLPWLAAPKLPETFLKDLGIWKDNAL